MADHKTWGNNFQWTDPGKTIVGWLPFRSEFQAGDEILCDMNSGKTGRYRVTSVKYYCEPQDMFFADVEGIGYVET